MKRFLLLLLLSTPCFAIAGNWQFFPSADQYRRVQCAGDEIYLLQGNRLIQADGPSWTFEHEYNRQNGLSDINIVDIIYAKEAQKLAIIYSNGLIDFLHADHSITNLPDLKETPAVGQSKHINHVLECNGILCVGTDLGFLGIDPKQESIRDCISTEQPVDYVWMDDSSYYYRTKSGDTFCCPLSANLFNPNSWSSSKATPPLPKLPDGAIDACHSVTGDTLYTLYSDRGLISSHQEQALDVVQYQQGNANNRLYVQDGTLSACHVSDLTYVDYNTNVMTKGYLSEYNVAEAQWVNTPNDSIIARLSSRKTFGGLMDMVPDPSAPHRYYYSTLENGIYIVQDGKLEKRWDSYDGTGHVEAFAGNSARVGGLAFSPNNDFWFVNEGLSDILRVRTHNGFWYKYAVSGADGQVSIPHLIHSTHGNASTLWGCKTVGYQKCFIFAYDYAGTFAKTNDDRSVTIQKFTDENGKTIHPYYFNNIAEGPDGAIWILTTQGIFVIDEPEQVFEHPGKVRTVFDNVNANAIVFDPENRIWIGTTNRGLLLYDQTGKKLLQQFSTENCILSSNEILALAFDPTSHTLWTSCPGGLFSYQYDPADYAEPVISDAYCYPTKVKAGETTPITIAGLTDLSTVSIQNADGQEVLSAKVVGRTASIDGSRLAAGEYFVVELDEMEQPQIVTSFCIEP